MSRKAIALSSLLLASLASTTTAAADEVTATPATATAEDEKLSLLLAEDARRIDAVDPLDALYRGEDIDPADLAQVYTDALDRRRLASIRRTLRALDAIDRRRLSPENRLSYDILARDKRERAAWLAPDILPTPASTRIGTLACSMINRRL